MSEKSITQIDSTDIDAWLKQREEFITKVSNKMVEGKDYHIILGRKSLAKGGAEKIQRIMGLTTTSEVDDKTLQALGNPDGVVAYKTDVLYQDKKVTDGRGARNANDDKGDYNKAIKMAMKSSYVDAIIRASGLSDIFTQDLENMPKEAISSTKSYKPASTAKKAIKTQPSAPEGDIDIAYDGKPMICENCERPITAGVKSYSERTYQGKALCFDCQRIELNKTN